MGYHKIHRKHCTTRISASKERIIEEYTSVIVSSLLLDLWRLREKIYAWMSSWHQNLHVNSTADLLMRLSQGSCSFRLSWENSRCGQQQDSKDVVWRWRLLCHISSHCMKNALHSLVFLCSWEKITEFLSSSTGFKTLGEKMSKIYYLKIELL